LVGTSMDYCLSRTPARAREGFEPHALAAMFLSLP
jgi:hypothetical protein